LKNRTKEVAALYADPPSSNVIDLGVADGG